MNIIRSSIKSQISDLKTLPIFSPLKEVYYFHRQDFLLQLFHCLQVCYLIMGSGLTQNPFFVCEVTVRL